ncbi:hypothetical protein CC1G_03247 [Coprinopsis cinerea okayama7|uniref:Uncharacterized protein n=1 Tax=Coprinopsis cinerea (strain Okayama-7 / 130 / ATCC MYA-4618 / FGSC 9003) TaxID=240176 RepID=A8N7A4_COPC7|nr:hypothetical protein CC1G_03247 [Coprinopsis cinerea okayama7\|eukprot:XP_001830710.2 hypothetical protein CC1G_03247 [Coprinopsis cinerea okayama7\
MPLFKSKSTRRASASPTRRDNHTPIAPNDSHSNGGFFSRRRSVDSNSRSSSETSRAGTMASGAGSTRSGGGFFGLGGRNRIDNDPSIMSARQKVSEAEIAEREADQALLMARERVREAREHVKLLEREAIDDARRAKAKQAEAKVIHKSVKGLGRHG